MYYECASGHTLERVCGPGLEFNPSFGNCDWPYNNTNENCQRSLWIKMLRNLLTSKETCDEPFTSSLPSWVSVFGHRWLNYCSPRPPSVAFPSPPWGLQHVMLALRGQIDCSLQTENLAISLALFTAIYCCSPACWSAFNRSCNVIWPLTKMWVVHKRQGSLPRWRSYCYFGLNSFLIDMVWRRWLAFALVEDSAWSLLSEQF